MAIPTVAGRIRRHPGLALAVSAVAVAAASLALPFAPVYDAWAWLLWGDEVAGLDLDTAAGPSWKPLPVLFTTPFSAFGDAAPDLWLVVARAGWLLAAALAFRLAVVLEHRADRRQRLLAGAIAAAGVVLLSDPFTPWLRQFAGGLSEPLLVAAVLGAIERELAGRRGQALALGVVAALLRPEAWPFVALYCVWLWRRAPALGGALLGAAACVPALWLLPDLIASGDALTGAGRARGGTGSALEALGRAAELPLAALWAAAAWAVASARRRGERAIPLLAAGAVAWIALVAALAAIGYAGLPRFSAPAAALVCVLGGCGVVRLGADTRAAGGLLGRAFGAPRRALAAGLALVVAAIIVQGAFRVADLPDAAADARDLATGVDDLLAVAERAGEATSSSGPGGAAGTASCEGVATSDLLTQTALAWRLEQPIAGVAIRVRSLPQNGLAFIGPGATPRLRRLADAGGPPAATVGEWSAYAVSCASSASERRIAGVSGARR